MRIIKYFENLKYSKIYELVLPFYQRYELVKWHLRKKQPPTPHLIKQYFIKAIAHKYGIDIFIETGTYLGVMVNSVKKIFKKIFTIELDSKLYQLVKKKLQKYKHVTVLKGDSSKVLPSIIKKLGAPSLFWLDAHFSGGITARGGKETPVLDEIKEIVKSKRKHIVLIDDANCFGASKDYPNIMDIEKVLKKSLFKYDIKKVNNMLLVTPEDV